MHHRYIAIKPISLADGTIAAPGEEVPNAHTWQNLPAWLGTHVRLAAPDELPELKPAPKPKAEPAPVAKMVEAPSVDALEHLTAMMAEITDDRSKYTITEMLEAAEAAGVQLEDPAPRRKDAVVMLICAAAGITL